MDFSISEYWDIFTSYINPFSIISSGIKWGAIAFFFFLLLVIFLHKFILVKRKYLIFKILAWTYIIVIPILGGFFGFKWGIIHGLKNDLKTHMSSYTGGFDQLLTGAIGYGATEFISEITTGKDSSNFNLSTDQAVDKLADLIYTSFGSTLEKEVLGDGSTKNKIAVLFLKITKSSTISYGMKSGIRELLHSELGLEEGTSKILMAKKFGDLLSKGLFTSIMQVQVERFFTGMEKSLYFLFSMILLFPVLEVSISNFLYRRKMKQAAIVPSPSANPA